jgi:hypothetical protein
MPLSQGKCQTWFWIAASISWIPLHVAVIVERLNLKGKLRMTTLFTIELTINMIDSGRHARQLLNLYHPDMPVDIIETAFNLCDANEALQARKFANLTLKRSEVWSSQEGSLKIFALLSVSGEDSTFIKQVITKYMDGFPDCLKRVRDRDFSRNSFPPAISLQPTDWKVEVH